VPKQPGGPESTVRCLPPATALVHLRCATFQCVCRVRMRVFGLALLVKNAADSYRIMIAEL
jgi:hypothetical protein